MFEIAICDDDLKMVVHLTKIVEIYAKENDLRVKIDPFFDGIDLISKRKKYDLYLLDIDMPNLDGIETAKEIRRKDMNCKIIYITNHKDYAHQAFSVKACGYIMKPFGVDEIASELNYFFSTCNKEEIRHQVTFRGKYSELAFTVEEIYYFEIIGKNIVEVVVKDKKELIYCPLNDIFDKVEQYSFTRPHQSIIVNMFYVDKIFQFDILMKNGKKLPVAQKRLPEFRKQLFEYVQKNI